jgi:hypothetical protein
MNLIRVSFASFLLFAAAVANWRIDYVGRQLRNCDLHDRNLLVRRSGKGLQRSDLFYG